MLRTRLLRPGIVTNEILAELGPEATLLFERLWMLADREGRLEDRPARIRAEAFPYWPDFPVENLVEKLCKSAFLTRYSADGCNVIVINNFAKHQHVHVHEPKSRLPPQSGNGSKSTRSNRERKVRNVSTLAANGDRCTLIFTSNTKREDDVVAISTVWPREIPPPPPPETPSENPPEKTPENPLRVTGATPRKPPRMERNLPPPPVATSADRNLLRESLDSLAREIRMPPPDDDIVGRVFAAGRGATAIAIHEALVLLYKRQKFREMRSWGFVPVVLAGVFGRGVIPDVAVS